MKGERSMGQLRRPTREQKIAIKKCGYNSEDYSIVRRSDTDEGFKIIHKETHDKIEIYY